MVEADERLAHDEPTLREVTPLGWQGNGRLEGGHVVVGEVADDGKLARLRLLERDEA